MKRNYDDKDPEERCSLGHTLAETAYQLGRRGKVYKPQSSQPPEYSDWYVKLFRDAYENAARKNRG